MRRCVAKITRRRRAADWLLAIADPVAKAGVAPMPMREIDAEVKAVRARRRRARAKALQQGR